VTKALMTVVMVPSPSLVARLEKSGNCRCAAAGVGAKVAVGVRVTVGVGDSDGGAVSVKVGVGGPMIVTNASAVMPAASVTTIEIIPGVFPAAYRNLPPVAESCRVLKHPPDPLIV